MAGEESRNLGTAGLSLQEDGTELGGGRLGVVGQKEKEKTGRQAADGLI